MCVGTPQNPGALRTTRKRLKKKLLLLLLRGLLLRCRLLGCLLLSHHSLPPSLRDTDPRFHGLAGWIPSCDVMDNFFCTYLLCNQRVSPRSLIDEVSATLAVVRNGPLTRVGSVASVVATTSSIAIQVVLIHRLHTSRQVMTMIFFHALSREMLRMWDIHDVSRPLEGPPTHRMRAM